MKSGESEIRNDFRPEHRKSFSSRKNAQGEYVRATNAPSPWGEKKGKKESCGLPPGNRVPRISEGGKEKEKSDGGGGRASRPQDMGLHTKD